MLISIMVAVLLIAIAAVSFMLISGRSHSGLFSGKNRASIMKNVERRLSQNPRDPEALSALGDVYYQDEAWDKSMRTYENLVDILTAAPAADIDLFEIHLRYALSAMRLNMTEQAYKGFSMARSIRQDNFEVNYNLGHLEFERKNYEKALQLLQQARIIDPESPAVLRDMGHAFFRLKKPKEAMNYIRKAIDLAPDDKESLYTLAECYYEANQTDQALRIFNHLRADPTMGPSACLIAGTICIESRQNEQAIQDFEIGLRHQNIKVDILAELRYKLATTYLKQNEIGKAIPLLKILSLENQSYKDVNVLLSKYQELNANKNLQIFTLSPSADFVALCRKIVMIHFARAKVKVVNISVNKNEWADILAEINTPKWSDLIMFRFIRNQGSIGELIVRDFHSHLKEVKAGKGVCMTVGNFTEEAKRYTEARLIDLVEKERLSAILNSVDAKTAALPAGKQPVKR
jgi:tetratricopeptide (TPR) repeat protein